jgi:hypothetical protein
MEVKEWKHTSCLAFTALPDVAIDVLFPRFCVTPVFLVAIFARGLPNWF